MFLTHMLNIVQGLSLAVKMWTARAVNITLVQWFGGIAWFSLAYGCNDDEEDNSCDDKTSRTITYPGNWTLL